MSDDPVALREELRGDSWRTVRVRGTQLGLHWHLDSDGYWYAGENPLTWDQLVEFDGPLIPLAFNGPIRRVLAEIVKLRRQVASMPQVQEKGRQLAKEPAQSTDIDLQALAKLVEKVNGFVYQGHGLDAIVNAVIALREDPELAAKLLGGSS